ncbi:nucleoside diphosphate kinase [candidate division TA06 bacterium DG_26]|uniref:Nucleoside diphosphate kinase n=1 Tax=candidate division TA06 bacterium DG_26 TaxID=1703771 RepID=A0A0S7WJB9_UNCT6|nr:MAG: nucleoside diphosphate kinase [candidate division TA06 bacterium DG_26]
MKQRSLLVIKPDGVQRRLIGRIISRLEKEGFDIVEMRMMRLSQKKAESLYRAHKGKDFYLPLVDFVTSGPVVALVLARNDALAYLREVVGATDPAKAAQGTLREQFGTDVQRNTVHAAATEEDANREIRLLFGSSQ